jgi:hypothetical protein
MKIPFEKKSLKILRITSIVFLLAFFSFGFIYALRNDDRILFYMVLFGSLVLPIGLVIDIRMGIFNHYIEINDVGVKFVSRRKRCEINWEEIRLIGVSRIGYGKAQVIVFSTVYDLSLLNSIFIIKQISSQLIYVGNRKGLISEVKKYWKKEIANEINNRYS